MPLYSYKIVDGDGIPRNGAVEGESREKILADFHKSNCTVIELTAGSSEPAVPMAEPGEYCRGSLSDRSLIYIARQLALLFRPGVSPAQAIDWISLPGKDPQAVKALESLRSDPAVNSSFGSALNRHRAYFGSIFTGIISRGGSEEDFSQRARATADLLENNRRAEKIVEAAVFYPAGMIFLFLVLSYLLLVAVFPGFEGFFKGAVGDGMKNFPLTGAFVAFGKMLSLPPWSYYVPLFFVFLLIGGFILKKTGFGKAPWEKLFIFHPAGRIIRLGALARFCRTFGVLCRYGFLPEEAFDMAVEASKSAIISESSRTVREYVSKGDKFYKAMERTAVFPPMVVSGAVNPREACERMQEGAELFEMELARAADDRQHFCGNLTVFAFGIFILLLVLSILLPLLSL